MKTIYKSELKELETKEFDSVEALEKAEAEVSEKIAAKQKASEEKKAEADVVKAAIVKRVKAEIAARKSKNEAYKAYLEVCDAEDKKVAEAKQEEGKTLKAFSAKYGGFHDTITIDDVTYRYDYDNLPVRRNQAVDAFSRLFDFLF